MTSRSPPAAAPTRWARCPTCCARSSSSPFSSLALVAIVPRISAVAAAGGRRGREGGPGRGADGWPVELPEGLGDGWVPTVATSPGHREGADLHDGVEAPERGRHRPQAGRRCRAGWVDALRRRRRGRRHRDGRSRTWERSTVEPGHLPAARAGKGLTLAVRAARGAEPEPRGCSSWRTDAHREDELQGLRARALGPVTPAPGVRPAPSSPTGLTGRPAHRLVRQESSSSSKISSSA